MSLEDSFNKTNLDMENPSPSGGPNSFPRYNHHQKYSPNKTYLDTHQSERSITSDFGINGINSEGYAALTPINSFSKTSLDTEDPNPVGGPNRSNAGDSNTPNGIYSIATENGVLQNKNGDIARFELQKYSSNNKYLDNIKNIDS